MRIRIPSRRKWAPLLVMFAVAGSLLSATAGTVQAETSRDRASSSARLIDFYEFRPRHADRMCLDVAHASVAHAADVVQGTCWGGTNQHWQWIQVAAGVYEIRAQHSDMCLDVAHASPAHGANVVQGRCTSGNNQHWRFIDQGNGFFELRPAHTNNKCLDVAHASTAHGADVIQANCSRGTNQQWRRL